MWTFRQTSRWKPLAKVRLHFVAPHAVDELNERECKNDYASKQNSTGDRGVTRHWSRYGSGTCQGRGTRLGSLWPLRAGSGISRLRDPSERRTRKCDLGGSEKSERSCTASKTGALNRRRAVGCARAQRRNQQGGTHRGLHG